MTTCFFFLLAALAAASGNIIGEVRSAIGRGDFAAAEQLVEVHRRQHGVTPAMLEALSWLGRGALAAKQFDKAESYAQQTYELAVAQLATRKLDADRHLPIALGAAIEVQAQVLAARGERSAAVEYLNGELARYRNTSIRTRIQKNIHLLSLEGKPAPKLESGALPSGKPALLFFWAHWCPDCKNMAPTLARLRKEYGPKGLALVLPTQRYGYTRRGQDATAEEENRYIGEIRRRHYAEVADAPAPVSEEDFKNYGASTTPTLVLVDRRGVVRLYHPGQMTYEELEPKVRALF
jgi:thiol-disulfide isomerase/thioredoxin